MGEQTALLEFEAVRQEYREKDAIGIPMSVREGYERVLSEIRKEHQGTLGKRSGTLLVEQGAFDKEKLEGALAEQEHGRRKWLLDEILVDLGFVRADVIRRAIEEQAITEAGRPAEKAV